MMDRKTDYALRAAVFLAGSYPGGLTATTAEIAENSGAPRGYLVHILLALKNKTLLASTPGRKGGYRLMRRPELISVAEIVRAVTDHNDKSRARGRAEAGVYGLAFDIVNERQRKAVNDVLSDISLAELLSAVRERAGKAP